MDTNAYVAGYSYIVRIKRLGGLNLMLRLLLGDLLGLLARDLWGTMAARGGRASRELFRGIHRLACAPGRCGVPAALCKSEPCGTSIGAAGPSSPEAD